MEYINGLIIPGSIVVGFSGFIYKVLNLPEIENQNMPEAIQGMLTLNVFKGSNTENVSIDASSTLQTIAERLYTTEELQSQQIIFVYNGRRLNNQRTIGEQGIRNGSFLHSQIANFSRIEEQEESNHVYITLSVSFVILLLFWCFYLKYPGYFSFISKTLLLGFSELLLWFIYYQIKNPR